MPLTDAELENRRKYIGGSDARTVLEGDVAAWKALRLEKITGERPPIPERLQFAMDIGTAIEPLTLREFNKKVPLLADPPRHMVWKDDPILAFSPDGLTEEHREVVQAKFHSGDQDIGELAQHYKAQLTHEMICSKTNRIWLAVTFGHYCKFQHMEIKRDGQLTDQYLMKAMEFKHYWQTGQLPPTMVDEVVDLTVERKRDHVWPVGDNEVAPLCTQIMDNFAASVEFEDGLAKMKKIIKRKEYADCGSLTWRNIEDYGVTFKLDARNAVRFTLAFPKRIPMKDRAKLAKSY